MVSRKMEAECKKKESCLDFDDDECDESVNE